MTHHRKFNSMVSDLHHMMTPQIAIDINNRVADQLRHSLRIALALRKHDGVMDSTGASDWLVRTTETPLVKIETIIIDKLLNLEPSTFYAVQAHAAFSAAKEQAAGLGWDYPHPTSSPNLDNTNALSFALLYSGESFVEYTISRSVETLVAMVFDMITDHEFTRVLRGDVTIPEITPDFTADDIPVETFDHITDHVIEIVTSFVAGSDELMDSVVIYPNGTDEGHRTTLGQMRIIDGTPASDDEPKMLSMLQRFTTMFAVLSAYGTHQARLNSNEAEMLDPTGIDAIIDVIPMLNPAINAVLQEISDLVASNGDNPDTPFTKMVIDLIHTTFGNAEFDRVQAVGIGPMGAFYIGTDEEADSLTAGPSGVSEYLRVELIRASHGVYLGFMTYHDMLRNTMFSELDDAMQPETQPAGE